ncbi:MAG: hypothetical protein E4G96_01595 [Chrysiogenales bacterium]|nr:MAG: hypothetical protein E4G96_01595 [Chrysiogenales bacterium]
MNKSGDTINCAYVADSDDVFLSNSIFGENYCRELQAIDKHEIVVKICDILGPDPSNLCLAEQIFEDLKFEMTRYVLHHEYCRQNSICSQLLIWLDSSINPANAKKLSRFIAKYLK